MSWLPNPVYLPMILLSLGVLGGCGSKDPFPLAPVQGTVSYQGKPLQLGRVVFIPDKGTPGLQAVGKIERDGSFRMSTANRDGVAIGTDLFYDPESMVPLRSTTGDKTLYVLWAPFCHE